MLRKRKRCTSYICNFMVNLPQTRRCAVYAMNYELFVHIIYVDSLCQAAHAVMTRGA